MIEKDLKELENNFLNHLGEYYGVKTYENKATKLKVFKRQFNIFKQTDNFVEFLDVLIKLSKKPDDKESLEKIVEYAKSLGI